MKPRDASECETRTPTTNWPSLGTRSVCTRTALDRAAQALTAGSIRWTGFDKSKWSWSELGSTVTTRYEALFAVVRSSVFRVDILGLGHVIRIRIEWRVKVGPTHADPTVKRADARRKVGKQRLNAPVNAFTSLRGPSPF